MINKKDMEVNLEAGIIDIPGIGIVDIDLIKNAYERIKQIEGIERAKKGNKTLGRPINIPKDFLKYYYKVERGEITATNAAKILGISRAGFYRIRTKMLNGDIDISNENDDNMFIY